MGQTTQQLLDILSNSVKKYYAKVTFLGQRADLVAATNKPDLGMTGFLTDEGVFLIGKGAGEQPVEFLSIPKGTANDQTIKWDDTNDKWALGTDNAGTNGLTSVATDDTIDGDGTPGSPLKIKLLTVDSTSDLPTLTGSNGKYSIVLDSSDGGLFKYDSAKVGINDGGHVYNGWVRIRGSYSDAKHFDIDISVQQNQVSQYLAKYIQDSDIFVDNTRQFNFHIAGAALGEYAELIPDDKFVVNESSKSVPERIGACNTVLFVGDSLTARNDNYSFTDTTARQLAEAKGGFREIGYLPIQTNGGNNNAKSQGIGIDYIFSSGWTDIASERDPTHVIRTYSPDGNGSQLRGGNGAHNMKIVLPSGLSWETATLYYLEIPQGGTFDIEALGDATSKVSIDTDSPNTGSRMKSVMLTPSFDGSGTQYNVTISGMIGSVTLYGISLESSNDSGFSYDVFARSGITQKDINEFDSTSLATVATARQYDTIVINIGTNDSSQAISVSDFVASLTTYVARLKAALPDSKFVIVSPNASQWHSMAGKDLRNYAAARRSFSRNQGHMYIDLTTDMGNFNFIVNNGWLKDGTHPNAKGQHIIGTIIAKHLKENMLPSSISI